MFAYTTFMSKIILTGGGTGGHILPHLSLKPYLKNTFNEIIYLGTKEGLEYEIIGREKDITFEAISAFKLDRSKILGNILLPFKVLGSISKAKKILKEHKPNVIFSKGGFVSVPVAIAGKMLKIPVVSHESDLTMGLANKIIYKFCDTFCTTFPATTSNLKKAVYTGSPIRSNILNGNKEKGYLETKVDKLRPTLLVMGGSTGALSLNEALYSALPTLLNQFNVIHIVGKGKGDTSKRYTNYCQIEYCYNIEDILSISDIVISRAGSNAIYELLALKKPMILVPLPKDASRGDQIDNAKYFETLGYSKTLFQEDITTEKLIEEINDLYKNKDNYISKMKSATNITNGAENIYKEILKVVKNKKNC